MVQSEKAADLRAFYRKLAKNDRIDTWVLAKIPFVNEEGLNSLYLPTAEEQALRRLSPQREKLVSQASAGETIWLIRRWCYERLTDYADEKDRSALDENSA